jgi:hypothetical protein
MKRKILTIAFVVLATLSVLAQDNPYSVWCGYHSRYFSKMGKEYAGGRCYDKYEHGYHDRETGALRTHRMSMPCP